MTTKHVYLGRFAPFHKGHLRLILKLIDKAGLENTLILIGSSNNVNRRTPYTFEDRAKIIKVSIPEIEILPLPDGKAGVEYFDGSTNDIWLDSLEKLAQERKEKFVFYGGSKQDLEILAERFETRLLIDRFSEGEGLSATKIRELIINRNITELEKYVESEAMDLIIKNYQKA